MKITLTDAEAAGPTKPSCPHTGQCHPGHCPCLEARVASAAASHAVPVLTPEQRARLISSGPNAGRVRREGP